MDTGIRAISFTVRMRMRMVSGIAVLLICFVALSKLQATDAWIVNLEGKLRTSELAGSFGSRSVGDGDIALSNQRRAALALVAGTLTGFPLIATAEEDVVSRGFLQEYSDFTKTNEGYAYRDVKEGEGESPRMGDRAIFSWSGYTIGYFGRPFEAKGGPQGGAFDKDLDFSRTVLGSGQVVKGLECAMTTMKPGGVRQVLVPFGNLGYPADDAAHDRVGPKPTTFSGQRALNFVLENPRVDRTLLFNVKLVRVDKPDGKGGFLRGEKRS